MNMNSGSSLMVVRQQHPEPAPSPRAPGEVGRRTLIQKAVAPQ
jgi:hypothetical protein